MKLLVPLSPPTPFSSQTIPCTWPVRTPAEEFRKENPFLTVKITPDEEKPIIFGKREKNYSHLTPIIDPLPPNYEDRNIFPKIVKIEASNNPPTQPTQLAHGQNKRQSKDEQYLTAHLMTSQPPMMSSKNVNTQLKKRRLELEDDPGEDENGVAKRMRFLEDEAYTCGDPFLEDFHAARTRVEEEKSSRRSGDQFLEKEKIVALHLRSDACSGGQMENCSGLAANNWTNQASFDPGKGGEKDFQ